MTLPNPPQNRPQAGRRQTTPTSKPPWVSPRLDEGLAAVALGLICLITLANVVVRYFTRASFAFTEEISIFLMVVLTFAGASAAFCRGAHIRVDFFVSFLGPKVRLVLEWITLSLGVVLFGLVAWYGWKLFLDDFEFTTTSPGLGIPQWWYSIWLPVLSGVIVLRILGRMLRLRPAPEADAQANAQQSVKYPENPL